MKIFVNGEEKNDFEGIMPDEEVISIINKDEIRDEIPGIPQLALINDRATHGNRFEAHENFDFISMLIPNLDDLDAEPESVEVFLDSRHLTIISNNVPAIDKIVSELQSSNKKISLGHALILGFAHLTHNDSVYLAQIEDRISVMEDELVKKIPDDCVERIQNIRHELLSLKRYYEGLFDILEDMEENTNKFLEPFSLRILHMQTNRVDRLVRAVVNLRDYVSQVNEAYQNRMDISMNETMKFFTVITAVFAPLTLITGWYGMNLIMPEFEAKYAYPIVILLCLLIFVVCLLIFKKKKWF